jgi:hypothetical protein
MSRVFYLRKKLGIVKRGMGRQENQKLTTKTPSHEEKKLKNAYFLRRVPKKNSLF